MSRGYIVILHNHYGLIRYGRVYSEEPSGREAEVDVIDVLNYALHIMNNVIVDFPRLDIRGISAQGFYRYLSGRLAGMMAQYVTWKALQEQST